MGCGLGSKGAEDEGRASGSAKEAEDGTRERAEGNKEEGADGRRGSGMWCREETRTSSRAREEGEGKGVARLMA